MDARQVLVEVDAQPRRLGRQDVALLPCQRVLHQRQVESPAGLDRLGDQEVRDRGGQVDVGRPFHRPGIKMRRHLGVEDLGDGRELLCLQYPPEPPQGRLQDLHPARPQQRPELGLGRQPLARRQRNADMPRHFGEFQQVVRRDRLFVPERVVGLQGLPHADRARRGELAMGAEKEVRLVAHRLADLRAEGHRAGDVAHRRLMPASDRIGAGGVELHRGEALFHRPRRGLRRHVGIDPELRRILARLGVEIGVAPDPLVHLAAQERPDRPVARLAQDIPAGDLQPSEGAHHRRIGPLGETRGIDPAEHQLQVLRVLPRHVALEDVLDHRPHRLGADGRGIAFAITHDPVVGRQLRKDPVAPAPARGRRRHDEDFQILELHGRHLLPADPKAPPPRPLAHPRHDMSLTSRKISADEARAILYDAPQQGRNGRKRAA